MAAPFGTGGPAGRQVPGIVGGGAVLDQPLSRPGTGEAHGLDAAGMCSPVDTEYHVLVGS